MTEQRKMYSRVEVITEEGRVFVDYGEYVVSEQDGGKTLKIMKKIEKKKENTQEKSTYEGEEKC